jgi:hypothetical protein
VTVGGRGKEKGVSDGAATSSSSSAINKYKKKLHRTFLTLGLPKSTAQLVQKYLDLSISSHVYGLCPNTYVSQGFAGSGLVHPCGGVVRCLLTNLFVPPQLTPRKLTVLFSTLSFDTLYHDSFFFFQATHVAASTQNPINAILLSLHVMVPSHRCLHRRRC